MVIQRPGLRNPVVLGKATPHQFLIIGQGLVLELVHNGFGLDVGEHTVPGFHQEIQVGIVDVLAERWVGEDVVDRIVGKDRCAVEPAPRTVFPGCA